LQPTEPSQLPGRTSHDEIEMFTRSRRSIVLLLAVLAFGATATNARSPVDVPVWKTITVGAVTSVLALRNALDDAGHGVGDLAGQVLARPAFSVSRMRLDVDLANVSAAELGFGGATVRLADLYAQAQRLGFELAAAEVAPQLRLQYRDQPVGEFLHVGMAPITTWSGEPVILVVANGGAGLLLLGGHGHDDLEVPVRNRFLFVRPERIATD
jgi:hypothetical protein